MDPKFLERRASVAARNKTIASVSGSGWHKTDPQERERIAKGHMALCARPIAIQDDDRIHIVGACLPIVLAGLGRFLEAEAVKDAADRDREKSTMEKFASKVCRRSLAEAGESLVLPTQDWNGVSYALHAVGIDCVLAGLQAGPDEETG